MKIELSKEQSKFLRTFLTNEIEKYYEMNTLGDKIVKEHVDMVSSIIRACQKAEFSEE